MSIGRKHFGLWEAEGQRNITGLLPKVKFEGNMWNQHLTVSSRNESTLKQALVDVSKTLKKVWMIDSLCCQRSLLPVLKPRSVSPMRMTNQSTVQTSAKLSRVSEHHCCALIYLMINKDRRSSSKLKSVYSYIKRTTFGKHNVLLGRSVH